MIVVIDNLRLAVDYMIEPSYSPLADPAGKPDTFDVIINSVNGLPTECFSDAFIDRIEGIILEKDAE